MNGVYREIIDVIDTMQIYHNIVVMVLVVLTLTLMIRSINKSFLVCLPDMSHVYHMSITCLSHVYHMSITCLSHVYHMSSTCLAHV